jgi:carbon monoxide dehydrogenase subunit G
MKLEGSFKFEESQAQVWEAITNPRHLEKAIPGCASLKEYEPNKYDVLLKIAIPAVKGTYTIKFEMADILPPHQCRLIGEGSGGPGFVKGETTIKLTVEGVGTVVNYQGDVQVGGLIAGIGQRMIGGIAKMMLKQFFKNMSKELKGSTFCVNNSETASTSTATVEAEKDCSPSELQESVERNGDQI